MRSVPLETPPAETARPTGSGAVPHEELAWRCRSGEAAGKLEELAVELARRLSGLEEGDLDEQIAGALARVAALLASDDLALLEWAPADEGVVVSRSWWQGGASHAPEEREIRDSLPRFFEALRRGELVTLEGDASRLGPWAPDPCPPRPQWVVPVAVRGRWVCALAAGGVPSPRSWSVATLEGLRSVGAVLAQALVRRQLEADLRQARSQVHRLEGHLAAESAYRREAMDLDAGFETLIGRSAALRQVIAEAAQVAPTSVSVLLLGETGTGKELLARAIHARSGRSTKPLVKVNCAALPPSLVESELFGHEKGAFTGATSARPGRFELADGGTLLLDEIGEIPLDVQVKLLRVLQDGEFERVGGSRTRRAQVRVIAATNRDLEQAIAEGRFREDLYYRLSAFPIRLPTLRERSEDVPLLVWNCIQQRQDELGRRIERVSDAAMKALVAYAWPGNVRELANVIERALILSRGAVLELDPGFGGGGRRPGPAPRRLADVERAHILRVLEESAWRINGRGNAAETLGLHPNTLRSRLKKLGLSRPTREPGVAAAGGERRLPPTAARGGPPQRPHEIA